MVRRVEIRMPFKTLRVLQWSQTEINSQLAADLIVVLSSRVKQEPRTTRGAWRMALAPSACRLLM